MSSLNLAWRGPTLCVLGAAVFIRVAAAGTESYEEWERAQQAAAACSAVSVQEYQAAQDREFGHFLATQWREYKAFEALTRNIGPKPRLAPEAPADGGLTKPGAPTPSAKVPELPVPSVPAAPGGRDTSTPLPAPDRPKPIQAPPTTPAVVPSEPPTQARPAGTTVTVVYFGRKLDVPIDSAWTTVVANGRSSSDAARFWEAMSTTRYGPTVRKVDDLCKVLELDDWGRVMLWQALARAMQPDSAGNQLMLVWFFLIRSGFDVRLGYSGNDVVVMPAVKQVVFATTYIEVAQVRYYALLTQQGARNVARVSTYDRRYPGDLRPLDIRAASTKFSTSVPEARLLSFETRGKRVDVAVEFDRQLVAYLGRFPQLDLDLYFASEPGLVASRSLLRGLRPHIEHLDEESAVNFLLAFVQKAFAYQTDEEQFGYEKYFFADEVLYFPYADCEDRAVLFSWLVRELLSLQTVGLHYTGHVTTAIAMRSSRPEWKTVEVSGKRFVIADPTYVNASVGMAMPSYERQKPIRIFGPY